MQVFLWQRFDSLYSSDCSSGIDTGMRYFSQASAIVKLSIAIYVAASVFLWLAEATSVVWLQTALGLAALVGLGAGTCFYFGLTNRRSFVMFVASFALFGLLVLYALYSRGLLF